MTVVRMSDNMAFPSEKGEGTLPGSGYPPGWDSGSGSMPRAAAGCDSRPPKELKTGCQLWAGREPPPRPNPKGRTAFCRSPRPGAPNREQAQRTATRMPHCLRSVARTFLPRALDSGLAWRLRDDRSRRKAWPSPPAWPGGENQAMASAPCRVSVSTWKGRPGWAPGQSPR